MRKGKIYFKNKLAGFLTETEEGYEFLYSDEYINDFDSKPVSLTLPLRKESFTQKTMFPFFDGLIPEGWMLNLAVKNWKLNINDRMGLLLTCCSDTIGAVSILPVNDNE
jgi:serine/threonine-protein kinase HipA